MKNIIFLLGFVFLFSTSNAYGQSTEFEDFDMEFLLKKYENSEVGMEITFPEGWLGLKTNVDEHIYVFTFPLGTEQEPQEPAMILIMITDPLLFSEEDLSSEEEFCEIPPTASIVEVQKMKALKFVTECEMEYLEEPLEFLFYGFETKENIIAVGYGSFSEISYETHFDEFEKSLNTVIVEDYIDLSDPYAMTSGTKASVQSFDVLINGDEKEIILLGTSQISEFSYSENPSSISFTPVKIQDLQYEAVSVYINDYIDSPYSVQIDGASYDGFIVVTDETTGNISIEIEYDFPVNQISISGNTYGKQIPSQSKIPDWIRGTAGWWAQGVINDSEFVSGIQYMIQKGIITLPATSHADNGVNSNQVPSWIKNNADWWAQGLISDNDFLKGIQYLVERGIIEV